MKQEGDATVEAMYISDL